MCWFDTGAVCEHLEQPGRKWPGAGRELTLIQWWSAFTTVMGMPECVLGCKWMQDSGSDPAAQHGVSGQQVIDSTMKGGLFGKSVEVPMNENWSTVPTIQKLAWSLLQTILLKHLIYLKKPLKQPHILWNVTTQKTCSWSFWGVTVGFCHSRTTSLLQMPTMCWPARGAAPTCWTKWNTPSSAGSSRSRSSASLSLTVTLCWAKGAQGRNSRHVD